MAKYLDETGLQRLAAQLKEQLAGKAGKEYVDGLIGDVGAILDEINGEVV